MPVSEQERSIGLRSRYKPSDVYTRFYDSSNLVAAPSWSQFEAVWPLLVSFRVVQGQQYVFQMGRTGHKRICSRPRLKNKK